MLADTLRIRKLGQQGYHRVWNAMRAFTEARGANTPDEVWFLQHPPVFTQGRNGRSEHILSPGDIPVIRVDRGGQVTYHGPGQLVAYTLIDIARRDMGIRQFVELLEHSIIAVLATYGIESHARRTAPGVYVRGRKIASLGVRVRRGRCYHGLSLNVAMDLEPFERIDPCGFPGLQMSQLREHSNEADPWQLVAPLATELAQRLGHRHTEQLTDTHATQILARYDSAA